MNQITVLCNRAMLDLLTPAEHSRPVPNIHGDPDYVAVYDEAALDAVPESAVEDAGAFWRHTPGLTIDVPFDPEVIKRHGLRGYISETVNLSNEKHTAGAIAELARNAGMSQIEFMNWCADNIPAAAPAPTETTTTSGGTVFVPVTCRVVGNLDEYRFVYGLAIDHAGPTLPDVARDYIQAVGHDDFLVAETTADGRTLVDLLTPSPTGAPWVEADDGEPCVPGPDGTWVEQPDGHRVVVPPARRATTVTVRPTTRANPPAQQPVRRAPKARSRR